MKPRWIFAVFGDLHVNSTVALCPPRVPLDDGGEYRASPMQAWIWGHWRDYWGRVGETAARYPEAEVWGVCLGELADNNYHKSSQLITLNPVDQMTAAEMTMDVAKQHLDWLVVLRGTEAHSGLSGAWDEALAQELGAMRHGDGNYSAHHWAADFGGWTLDAAHHPGTGHMRPWTRGGDANRLAAMTAYSYIDNGMWPPSLAVRGHNHKPSDSADNHPTRAVITPSWQLTNAYGYRLGSIHPLPIGGVIVTVQDRDNWTVEPVYAKWPVKQERFVWSSKART